MLVKNREKNNQRNDEKAKALRDNLRKRKQQQKNLKGEKNKNV